MDLLMEHLGRGIIIMLLLSMPSVLVAASIGLVVGILQAVTQVQEQTIAAAPKILGVFLVIIMLGNFSINAMKTYFQESANIAFNLIPRDEETVLPPSGIYTKGRGMYEDNYYSESRPQIKDAIKNPGKIPVPDEKYKKSYIKTPTNNAYPPNLIEQKKINEKR